jgi:hypothetical protein
MSNHPSTAFIQRGHPDADSNGEYVPCKDNQHSYYKHLEQKRNLEEASADGSAPRFEHPTKMQGYCPHGVLGGCGKDE